MNMTLTEAMKRLEIFAGQQMNGEMETAIRTVLAEMQKRVEVVRCSECKYDLTDQCDLLDEETRPRRDDFCSYGERK